MRRSCDITPRAWSIAALTLGALAIVGCPQPAPPDTEPKTSHEKVFTELLSDGYQGPASCLYCHSDRAEQLLATGHWNWQGLATGLAGRETEVHGKQDLINNFFIGVRSNEARCSQCHPSYGWTDRSFDFFSTRSVDCFICHDTTGSYAKHPTANGGGGAAALLVDGALTVVDPNDLQNIAYNVGTPTRANCGACHFYADGGDNAKHGDMSSALITPSRELDVHMGGLDYRCQECHTSSAHGIAGMSIHSRDEGDESARCTRCHTGTKVHQEDPVFASVINIHMRRIACETCHIPTYARSKPTLMEWYWDEAGEDVSPVPLDRYGMPTYSKEYGRLVWRKEIVPVYRWYNGTWNWKIVGSNDTYIETGTANDPIVLAEPVATIDDPDAKIYPFKRMLGRQPADIANQRLIVPHLFGDAAGANPFWSSFDWNAALQEGAAYTGQDYSGQLGFVNTVMYLKLAHTVPPAEQALLCDDCHGVDGWFESLGYEQDPWGQ